MKHSFFLRCLFISLILLPLSLLLVSCLGSQNAQSNFCNAGNADLNVTGAQVAQYWLFRFDTTISAHNLNFPSAADIVSNLTSPIAGEVLAMAVTSDGNNSVALIGGANVTIKPSASTVAGNTTHTIYCELDNVKSGSEAVTIY